MRPTHLDPIDRAAHTQLKLTKQSTAETTSNAAYRTIYLPLASPARTQCGQTPNRRYTRSLVVTEYPQNARRLRPPELSPRCLLMRSRGGGSGRRSGAGFCGG